MTRVSELGHEREHPWHTAWAPGLRPDPRVPDAANRRSKGRVELGCWRSVLLCLVSVSLSDTSLPRDGKTLHSNSVAQRPTHSRPSTSSCRYCFCCGHQRCFQSVGSLSFRALPGPSWPPHECLASGDNAGPGMWAGLAAQGL